MPSITPLPMPGTWAEHSIWGSASRWPFFISASELRTRTQWWIVQDQPSRFLRPRKCVKRWSINWMCVSRNADCAGKHAHSMLAENWETHSSSRKMM